jgi:adenylate cyclase
MKGQLDIAFEDAGEQQLKNIARPVRVHRVRLNHTAKHARHNLALPMSIAVLPFENLSGDPDQEYFADGMVEEIITALSRFNLFVIARNSSFTYKGRAVDVKQVGRELGVRYVLEGSVRRAGSRIRIAAQLIDASTGTHLWADRFDDALEDIFDVQDRVTANVVGAISSKMRQAEIDRVSRKPTDSLDAYDHYLRASSHLNRWTCDDTSEAMRLCYKAIELDSGLAAAYGMAAYCCVRRKALGWMIDRTKETAEAARLARRAVELGSDDVRALSLGGFTLAFVVGDFDDGSAIVDRALVLNPNSALAWELSGWTKILLGEPETAIEHLAQAMRRCPIDPLFYLKESATALAHFLAGRYESASDWAKRALRRNPNFPSAVSVLAASSALAGQIVDAQKAIARLRQLDPDARISNIKDRAPYRPEDLARLEEGWRLAGLPE